MTEGIDSDRPLFTLSKRARGKSVGKTKMGASVSASVPSSALSQPQHCATERRKRKLPSKASSKPAHHHKKKVPIPSFSLMDSFDADEEKRRRRNDQETAMDVSILDTPPKKAATKENVNVCNIDLLDNDDDECDGKVEDWLLARPVFQTRQTKREEEPRSTDDCALKPPKTDAAEPATMSTAASANRKDDKECTGDMECLIVGRPKTSARATADLGLAFGQTRNSTIDASSLPAAVAPPPPSQGSLFLSIDCLFVRADPATVTLKDIVTSLETEYSQKLDKPTRKLVKLRLTRLVHGQIQPSVERPCRDGNELDHRDKNDEETESEASGPLVDKSNGSLAAPAEAEKPVIAPNDDGNTEDVRDMFAPASVDLDKPKSEMMHAAAESWLVGEDVGRQSSNVDVEAQIGEQNHHEFIMNVSLPRPRRQSRQQPPGKKQGCAPATTDACALLEVAEAAPTVGHQPANDPIEVQKPSPRETKMRKRRRLSKTQNLEDAQKQPDVARKASATSAPKPTRKGRKKRPCAMCTTCPCATTSDLDLDQETAASIGLSRSERDIERALIRRMQRLERTVDTYEASLDKVKRELKNHRRKVWLKHQESKKAIHGKQLAFGDSRFLPDADVWDLQCAVAVDGPIPRPVAERAQGRMFCVEPKEHQPTLTQIFGYNTNRHDVDEAEVVNLEESARSLESDDFVVAGEVHLRSNGKEANDCAVEDHVDDDSHSIQQDEIQRVVWREGIKTAVVGSSPIEHPGVWSALTFTKPAASDAGAEKFVCQWDKLFSEDIAGESDGVDELFDLFEQGLKDSLEYRSSTNSSPYPSMEGSMLSPRGSSILPTIERQIAADSSKLAAIEQVCPQWRENVRFALAQRGGDELRSALERVRHSRRKLLSVQAAIATSGGRHDAALELFETAISESLRRLEDSTVQEVTDNSTIGVEAACR